MRLIRLVHANLLLLCCLLLLATAPAEVEQTGAISGYIYDMETMQPLGFANIVIVGTNKGAMSLDDGRFRLNGVSPGRYLVKAMMMGYKTVEQDSVEVYPDSTTELTFHLETTIMVTTQEILVTADRKRIDVTSVDTRSSVTEEQVKEMAVDRPIDAIALKTGIVKTGDELHARGGRSGETQMQTDGQPVHEPPLTTMNGTVLRKPTATAEQQRQSSAAAPQQRYVHAPPGSEQYDKISENGFHDVLEEPVSTFSIDVDAASYANVRRFISQGQFPPVHAVRVEELINYFDYNYPDPDGVHPFSITTEVAECPWNEDNRLVHIGIQGERIDMKDVPPSNLVFLIDVSGSMKPANKLPLLQSAFTLLVGQLREEDRVAIVCYAGTASLILDSTKGNDRDTILEAVSRLQAHGSTAGAAGIQLAYTVAEENFRKGGNNRVILATDGDFNVGLSSDNAMVKLIEEKRKSGVYLSVLGFGECNLQDAKMEKLADKGNGNYAYIDNILEAEKVLVSELGATLYTIAKDVKIQIEFNPARVQSYRLVGYENRMLARKDFDDDSKDAGELGAGHSVTALYEIIPQEDSPESLDNKLVYQDVRVSDDAQRAQEVLTVYFRYKPRDADDSIKLTRTLIDEQRAFADASENFRFSAAVAQFGLLLSESDYTSNATFEEVIDIARDARGQDDEGYRAEFVRMAKTCKSLKGE